MKVLKFGGGCLKDASAIKKVPSILKKYGKNTIIVISAFGKLTNLLEDVSHQKPIDFIQVELFFKQIMCDLSFDKEKINEIVNTIKPLDTSLAAILAIGELTSSKILSEYFQNNAIKHVYINAIDIIKTSNEGTSAMINWEETQYGSESIKNQINQNNTILTQGFIASFSKNTDKYITCLGREGSDYSAAIFGSMFDVDEVVLFKDVDGIYSSDPKKDKQAKLFHKLSYDQAFELCKKGNTVVHPKTIAPLKEKSIPLLIKNFNNIDLPGTVIN